jgi:hypothetical protein
MRQSLGTANSNEPIVLAPDDRWVWSIDEMINGKGKPKFSEKSYPIVTLSTTLESNPSLRGNKSATNHTSYYTAISQ